MRCATLLCNRLVLLLSACLFFIPFALFASTVSVVEPGSVREVIPIKEPEQKQVFYGQLQNFPHTYEFVAKEGTHLYVRVEIPKQETHLKSLIVTREELRGVSEVGRVSYNTSQWTSVRDPSLGRTFSQADALETDLEGGIYRIEVSSPENIGKYRLIVGTQDQESGLLSHMREAFVASQFLGGNPFSALRSPIIYTTVIVLVLLGYVVRRVYKNSKRVSTG